MTWLRIDDGFTEHRKVLELKRNDRWTWMEVLGYCARQSNGGHIPSGISDTMRWVTPSFLNKCADIGLLDREGTGYVVHDWSEYNPKDPTNAVRQQRYRNAKRNGEVTEEVTEPAVTNVTPRAQQRAPVPARPLPVPQEQNPIPVEIIAAWRHHAGLLPNHNEAYYAKPSVKRAVKEPLSLYRADGVIGAINNYALVLGSNEYLFSHRWTLEEFLKRGCDRFVDEANPLANKIRKPGNGGLTADDIFAQAVNEATVIPFRKELNP
jgi:hypothetical protein